MLQIYIFLSLFVYIAPLFAVLLTKQHNTGLPRFRYSLISSPCVAVVKEAYQFLASAFYFKVFTRLICCFLYLCFQEPNLLLFNFTCVNTVRDVNPYITHAGIKVWLRGWHANMPPSQQRLRRVFQGYINMS